MEHFDKVAQARPDYAFVAANFRQGIWTYLGRTEYRLNRLSEAHRSLERALVLDHQDSLAELYFGLTLARENDTARAVDRIGLAFSNVETTAHMDPRAPSRDDCAKSADRSACERPCE